MKGGIYRGQVAVKVFNRKSSCHYLSHYKYNSKTFISNQSRCLPVVVSAIRYNSPHVTRF
jgi:hypothetical protein